MSVWKKYFEEVLNGGQELVDEVDSGGVRLDSEGDGVVSEVIAREEVVWAVQKLKGKAAAGKMSSLQK